MKSNKYLYDCEAVITIGDGNIGKVFHYVNGKFDLHQRCYKMTDFKDIYGKYFYYFFSTKFYKRAMSMTAKTSVDSVRLEMISEMDIQYPKNIQEQIKLASILTNLDNLITLHQRKFEALSNIKKALLEKMFPSNGEVTPKIRFAGFTEAWEQRKLSSLGKIETGNTPSTSISEYYNDDGLLWVTPTDIKSNITLDTDKKLSLSGVKVARVIPENSILCTCIASIGKNTFLPVKCAFNQQINALSPSDDNDPYFLYTNSYHWSQTMKKGAGGLTFQIVNKTEFSDINTFIPIKEEQVKIGILFKQLDDIITLHQRE